MAQKLLLERVAISLWQNHLQVMTYQKMNLLPIAEHLSYPLRIEEYGV